MPQVEQIREWLGRLGLERYALRFAENGINLSVLDDLTDHDLEQLGVLVGHRRKILREISNLRGTELVQRTGPKPTERERRQLTVMFCDLVGSTQLSNTLDPEDYGELIRGYRKSCSQVIQACGGTVARFVGDGILAYFGYPQAHEDDPCRACRSGLGIIEAMGQSIAAVPLQARIACATGLVVVGDLVGEGAAEPNSVVGATPNLSAKLQGVAEPGTLVISDETRTLLSNSFEVRDIGTHHLAGISGPVRAWRVLRERQFESRFAARSRGSPSPLVGRQRELRLLLDRWRLAKSGAGQTVLLTGEAGVGKSRLVYALYERIASDTCTTMLYQCSVDHASSVLYPVIAQIEYAAAIARHDTPEEKLFKLEGLLGKHEEGRVSLVSCVAPLMGLPEVGHAPVDLSPQERKERTLAALVDRLIQLAAVRPVLLILEDVHWIDPSTRELLDLTTSRLRGMPILIIVTSRVETGELRHSDSTRIAISKFDEAESAQLLNALTENRSLPNEIRNLIMSRTEGVPLFIEELTKAILSSSLALPQKGEAAPRETPITAAIPATLRDSLMARLDLLQPGKTVAQLAATLGRTFSYELLSDVFTGGEKLLRHSLQQLVEGDLLVVNGMPPDARYTFRHVLIQDAAYDSLLRSKRQRLHRRVAAVLRSKFKEVVDSQPEVLARHLTLGANFLEAAREWQRAGRIAVQRSANQEAVIQFQNALAALEQAPSTPQNGELELDVLIRLAGALRATLGYAAADIGRLCQRALDLARQLNNRGGELQAISGLYSFHLLRSEYVAAEAAAQNLLEVAVGAEQRSYTMVAHRALGVVSFYFGHLKTAEQHLQTALDLYDKELDRPLAILYGADHAEMCACFLSQTKWVLGARSEAVALQTWAIKHGRALKHVHSVAQALAYRSFLFCLSRDPPRIEADADKALSIAREYRLSLMERFSCCTLAIASAFRTPSVARIDSLGDAIDRMNALAPNALRPFLLSVAAEICGVVGAVGRGLDLLREADAVMNVTAERWAEPEVLRVMGVLLIQSKMPDLGEEALRKALAIAQKQSAESWIARCSRDLARLFKEPADIGEA
jgi:class 3 adenylate cyclase/tetratricopeptide (TPR) repeat protein